MNIFVLDTDPQEAAKMHNNKHVVKMVLETAQLLCGVVIKSGGEARYKLTHVNHPCAIWARESLQNYLWLCTLGLHLSAEYTHRYNGKIHKSEAIILECLENAPKLPKIGLTPFALAMPEKCKRDSAVDSYRQYYIEEKASMGVWTKRETPEWFKQIQ